MIGLFVSGTGTGVGKTWFCGLLARRHVRAGGRVCYVKPVQTGCPPDDDAAQVRLAAGLPPDRALALHCAAEPVAPCFVFDPFPFDETVAAIRAIIDRAPCDLLLVEGAGGLLSPLDRVRQAWHFAQALDLGIVLVVPNRLGCLNDALLNRHFIATQGLRLQAVALNDSFATDARLQALHREKFEEYFPAADLYVFNETLTGPGR